MILSYDKEGETMTTTLHEEVKGHSEELKPLEEYI